MIGMYIVYFLVAKGGWDPYVTLLVSAPLLFVVGAGIFRLTSSRSSLTQYESDHADPGVITHLAELGAGAL